MAELESRLDRVVDLVDEGIDVALRVRTTLDQSGSLVVKQLGRTQALLAVSPVMLARQGLPAGGDELARLDTVSMSAVDRRDTWRLRGPGRAEHLLVHRPRYIADDSLTI